MHIYTLPDPPPITRALLRRLSGWARKRAFWKTFPSGEIFVRVEKPAERVVVIGHIDSSGRNVFPLMLFIDTLRRAGARDITLVLPYFAYGRQDRKKKTGDPLSSLCLLNIFSASGVSRVVTVDIHSDRILRASPIPIVNINIIPDIARMLQQELRGALFSVIAMDEGGKDRAARLQDALRVRHGAVLLQKKRCKDGTVIIRKAAGGPIFNTAVLVDDILDTGATVEAAMRFLRKKGAKTFYLCVTHPVFSRSAAELLRRLKPKGLIFSDTIPLSESARKLPGLRVFHVVESIAEVLTAQAQYWSKRRKKT